MTRAGTAGTTSVNVNTLHRHEPDTSDLTPTLGLSHTTPDIIRSTQAGNMPTSICLNEKPG